MYKNKNNFILGPLHCFLLGEAKLESYLERNLPLDKNIEKARLELVECTNYLRETITEDGDKVHEYFIYFWYLYIYIFHKNLKSVNFGNVIKAIVINNPFY